jgi:hypothetical protein
MQFEVIPSDSDRTRLFGDLLYKLQQQYLSYN